MHFPPCDVGQEVLVLCSLSDVGEDIDLSQRRLLKPDIIAVDESLGFLGSAGCPERRATAA